MPDLHILRDHSLGLDRARAVALQWTQEAEATMGLQCRTVPGDGEDTIEFRRTGVSGTLRVAADAFELNAKLGFLLSAFATSIEAEISKNLDGLLGQAPQR